MNIHAQQHYAQVPYTEFPRNKKINVESIDANSLTPLSKAWPSLWRCSRDSAINFCAKFYVNWTSVENGVMFYLCPKVNCGVLETRLKFSRAFPVVNCTQIEKKVLKRDNTSSTPLSKIRLSLHRFSRNLYLFNEITRRFFYVEFHLNQSRNGSY